MRRASLALAAALSGCGFSTTPTPPDQGPAAGVKVVHAMPDAPPVVVRIGRDTLAVGLSFIGLAYDEQYTRVQVGEQPIVLSTTTAPVGTVVAGSQNFIRNGLYTIVATGRVAGNPSTGLVIVRDDELPLGPGQGGFRVLHAATGAAPELDTYVAVRGQVYAATPSIPATRFLGAGSVLLAAGQYAFCAVPAGVRPANDEGNCVVRGSLLVAQNTLTTAVVRDPRPPETVFGIIPVVSP
ncbi:MAG: DUF4397 domain-containing protein [Gemmatimonadales bacterium]|nr:DUF4397 domain-containing protein [Gemmatimonadales bacterium]